MGIPIMVLGESGSGKTTSFRNLNPEKVMLFKVTNKPLPFRTKNWGKGVSVVTHNYKRVIQGIFKAKELGKKIIIIDDFQYLMSEEFLNRSDEKGFQKFVEIAVHVREVIRAAQNCDDDIRIYITWHTQIDENGLVKAKTIGKLLDEKICIEGLFTIVFRTFVKDGSYFFATQTNGYDVCKSPIDMFSEYEIPNDLKQIDETICEYYGINNQGEDQ